MNKTELYNKIMDMELLETYSYPEDRKATILITRVIGGWIYETTTGDEEGTYRPVFVPYGKDPKFKEKRKAPGVTYT